jgi:hypothetical protein
MSLPLTRFEGVVFAVALSFSDALLLAGSINLHPHSGQRQTM